MPQLTPSLWFDSQAMEAAEYYCSIFPNSKVGAITRYTEAGPGVPGSILTVDFELDGQRFNGINGGPAFTFDEAVSFIIECADQGEIDFYWNALTDGGEESQCGWLKDRYGVSWQVVPSNWNEFTDDEDPARVERAMRAMFGMKKIDIAAMRAAADGVELPTS